MNTLPSFSKVAVCSSRGNIISPAEDQVPDHGSYISAVARGAPFPSPDPPVTSIRPSPMTVAVGFRLFSIMLSVGDHEPANGS